MFKKVNYAVWSSEKGCSALGSNEPILLVGTRPMSGADLSSYDGVLKSISAMYFFVPRNQTIISVTSAFLSSFLVAVKGLNFEVRSGGVAMLDGGSFEALPVVDHRGEVVSHDCYIVWQSPKQGIIFVVNPVQYACLTAAEFCNVVKTGKIKFYNF